MSGFVIFKLSGCRPRRLLAVGAALASVCLTFQADAGAPDTLVSQKGRKFDPTAVELTTGSAVIIENDDGDLVHHAYVESDTFSFDSGDQQPGSRTRVIFSVPGDFKVLCGIHPKMKLAVHVSNGPAH